MTANLAANGGSLSASLSPEQVLAMLRAMPMEVARRKFEVVGFLMSCSLVAGREIPVLRAMLEAYPGSGDAYVCGPICVSAGLRGQGIAQAMFAELRRIMPEREGILFICRDNEASLRAHAQMEMREPAGFHFRDCEHLVLAYRG